MEYMSLAVMVRYGTPVLLFALVVLNVYQSTVIMMLKSEVKEMKESMTWGETCKTKHREIDRRLDKVERKGT